MTSLPLNKVLSLGHPHSEGFIVMFSPLEEEVIYIDEHFPILVLFDKSGDKIKEMMPDEAINGLNNGYFDSYDFIIEKRAILRLLKEGLRRYSRYRM